MSTAEEIAQLREILEAKIREPGWNPKAEILAMMPDEPVPVSEWQRIVDALKEPECGTWFYGPWMTRDMKPCLLPAGHDGDHSRQNE